MIYPKIFSASPNRATIFGKPIPLIHLCFRRLEGREDIVTVRIGNHYRALGIMDAGTVTWVWIGSHADYDRLIAG
jgi:hypothetical protein